MGVEHWIAAVYGRVLLHACCPVPVTTAPHLPMETDVDPFDWHRILINDLPWAFLGEVALRTALMFLILLVTLTAAGKREVRQLSVYELVLVIGLGSAAGDPMFYNDVPLVPAVVVFAIIMVCYKTATFISDRNQTIHDAIEGKPVYVVENGCIQVDDFDREDLSQDELFSELRQKGIEQLGQVRIAIREPSGELSVFPFEQNDVKVGLPILPKAFNKKADYIDEPGQYACCNCGRVERYHQSARQPICSSCGQSVWVTAVR